MSEEAEEICFNLMECLELRAKWYFEIADHRKPANKVLSCFVAFSYEGSCFRIWLMLSVPVT